MPNYSIRNLEDLRQGRIESSIGQIRPGWAMGPFYAADEIAFTRDFEIKEWDANLVRETWSNHVHNGPEYISVTIGMLTVICGECTNDTDPPVETERFDVSAGFSVILRPNFWRRYECTPETIGISVRCPKRNETRETDIRGGILAPNIIEQYKLFTEHWKHADQVRQMLLNNFLMISTILVAGWGLLYSQPHEILSMKLILITLSVMGLLLSLLWYCITLRASGYYNMYENEARVVEDLLPNSEHWPFNSRVMFRDRVQQIFGLRIRAATIISCVPLLFYLFFLLTAFL